MKLTPEEEADIAQARAASAPTRRPTVPALEERLFQPIPCLDHGFVRLIDYMGDDAAIVQAARVSYGKGTRQVREDRGLIRYLMRHAHTSPFEMCEIKLHCKMPIFVARQWVRHRMACLAGDSILSFNLPDAENRNSSQHHGVTIADLHRMWHEGTPTFAPKEEPTFDERVQAPIQPQLAKMKLRMCNEEKGLIEHTHVKDVWQSGVKPVFRVTLENGKSLKMTQDHRCLTESGWLTLGQATRLRRSLDGGVTWDTTAPAFATNGVALQHSEERPAPKRCPTIPRLARTWSRVVSIEYIGEEMTYDLEVTGPFHNFVANGFIVHNSLNEISARYSVLDKEFYMPRPEDLAVQSASNRQGRGDALSPDQADLVLSLLKRDATTAYGTYEKLLSDEFGLARELARMNLPVNLYTQWYWKIDLHNLLHFLRLRLDAHAQYEIRVFAEAIGQIVADWVPLAWEAFADYRMGGRFFSRQELAAVQQMLRGEAVASGESGLSAREWRELRAALGLED